MIKQNPCNIIIIIFMSVNYISRSGPFQPSKSMLVIFHVLLISLSVCLSTHTLLYSKYENLNTFFLFLRVVGNKFCIDNPNETLGITGQQKQMNNYILQCSQYTGILAVPATVFLRCPPQK